MLKRKDKNNNYYIKDNSIILKREILSNEDLTLENVIEGIGKITFPNLDSKASILKLFILLLKKERNKFSHISKVSTEKESLIDKIFGKFRKKDGEKNGR